MNEKNKSTLILTVEIIMGLTLCFIIRNSLIGLAETNIDQIIYFILILLISIYIVGVFLLLLFAIRRTIYIIEEE